MAEYRANTRRFLFINNYVSCHWGKKQVNNSMHRLCNILEQRNLGQVPKQGGQREVYGIKSGHPSLQIPCQPSLPYDLGGEKLGIIKADIIANLLGLLQTLLGGHKLFVSGHDNTQSLSQLGIRFLDLPLQDLHLLIGRVSYPLDGSQLLSLSNILDLFLEGGLHDLL